jgi:hypothetical protein
MTCIFPTQPHDLPDKMEKRLSLLARVMSYPKPAAVRATLGHRMLVVACQA